MIALVQDVVAEEEFGCKSSHEFLIIDRCPSGICLSLKIPLHVVVPRFLFCIQLITICWFVKPLNDDLGASLSHLTLNIDDIVGNESAHRFSSFCMCVVEISL